MDYKATLTGEPFLFKETVIVVSLLLDGYILDKTLLQKLIDENLFQYKTVKSVPKHFRAIKKRISIINIQLRDLIAKAEKDTSKLIVAYTIYQTQRIFKDIIDELIFDKYEQKDLTINQKDLKLFFLYKSQSVKDIEKWTESTKKKLNQVIRNILNSAEITNNGKLEKIVLPVKYHKQLIEIDSNMDKFLSIVTI